jgi:ABC-type multidrug transport system ATPase subunit
LSAQRSDCYNPSIMAEALIEARDLTKDFGAFRAVDEVDLQVSPGEVVALLGPNGAGKTTTIRMLASLLAPTRGEARIAGYDAARQPQEVRARVGLLTEHHGLYTRMRAEEYLGFFGGAYRMPRSQIEKRSALLLRQFGLGEDGGRRLGEYSKGMRQKLALVRALLHDPPVLLLDEPTSAMDPSSAYQVRQSISELRRASRAIIVCTHNLKEAGCWPIASPLSGRENRRQRDRQLLEARFPWQPADGVSAWPARWMAPHGCCRGSRLSGIRRGLAALPDR